MADDMQLIREEEEQILKEVYSYFGYLDYAVNVTIKNVLDYPILACVEGEIREMPDDVYGEPFKENVVRLRENINQAAATLRIMETILDARAV